MSDKYYKNPNEYLSRIVKRLITYDPDTGELFWSIRGNRKFYHSDSSYKRSVTLFHGKPALVSLTDGYRCGEVFGRGLRAHRVAWFLFQRRCNKVQRGCREKIWIPQKPRTGCLKTFLGSYATSPSRWIVCGNRKRIL